MRDYTPRGMKGPATFQEGVSNRSGNRSLPPFLEGSARTTMVLFRAGVRNRSLIQRAPGPFQEDWRSLSSNVDKFSVS